MSKIQEYLEQIRLARYGKDVRQAIHDAIHQCYEDGKAGEVDLIAREGVVSLREEVTEMQEDISKVHEDIATLDSRAEAIEIKTTKERTIKNTKHGGFRLNKIVANTVQNGTPSPSTPYPLLSTGDCVEMLENTSYQGGTGAIITEANRLRSKNTIPCKSGDVVSVYSENATVVVLLLYNGTSFVNSIYKPSNINTLTIPSGVDGFQFVVGNDTNFTLNSSSKITITINGKYLNCVKTYLKVEMMQGLYGISNGVFQSSTTEVCTKNKIPCKSSDIVKIKTEQYSTIYVLLFNGNTFSTSLYSSSLKEHTFTIPSGCDSFHFRVSLGGSTITPDTVGEIVLKINGVGETIAWYTTQYPMIGGSLIGKENSVVFKDNDGLWKFKREVGIQRYSASDIKDVGNPYNNVKYFSVPKPTDFVGYNSYWSYTLASNQYQNPPSDAEFDSTKCVGVIMSNAVKSIFWLGMPIGTTLAEVQANGDIEIMYPLATPIIETLDTQSQIALNGLETFDGMTIVEFDTRVQPLEFEAEVGTSKVGAYTLKSLNNSESNAVRMNELAVALVSL